MKRSFPPLSFVLLFFLLRTLTSCNYQYEEYVNDLDGEWDKDRTLVFQPVIKNSPGTYRIHLDLRHVYGFGEKFLKLRSRIETPSGKLRTQEHDVQVRKKGGVRDPEYLGDCSGDICDLRSVLYEEAHFKENGKYRIEIEHRMSYRKLTGVLGFGLLLEKKDPS